MKKDEDNRFGITGSVPILIVTNECKEFAKQKEQSKKKASIRKG